MVRHDFGDVAIAGGVAVTAAVVDDAGDVGDGCGGCACVHWSLELNGYCCETRWNELTVRCDFDSLHCVLVGRVGAGNDRTFRLDSYSPVNVVRNAVTGFPDCLWP